MRSRRRERAVYLDHGQDAVEHVGDRGEEGQLHQRGADGHVRVVLQVELHEIPSPLCSTFIIPNTASVCSACMEHFATAYRNATSTSSPRASISIWSAHTVAITDLVLRFPSRGSASVGGRRSRRRGGRGRVRRRTRWRSCGAWALAVYGAEQQHRECG